MTTSDTTSGLLNLLQIADSAFPVGSYAASRGWETLLAERMIVTSDDVVAVLHSLVLVTLAHSDLVAVREAHRLAELADVEGLVELDLLVTAMSIVEEWRDTSAMIGRRLLATVGSLMDAPGISQYQAAIAGNFCQGAQPVAWGVVSQALGIDCHATLLAYTQASVQAQVSVAARLVPLGQSVAVRLIHQLKPTVVHAVEISLTVEVVEMSGSLPRAELAGMAHRYAQARLFIS